jgi:hypothetical protein
MTDPLILSSVYLIKRDDSRKYVNVLRRPTTISIEVVAISFQR